MEIAISAIQFNHDPASARDSALNIRKNALQVLPVPEWRRAAEQVQDSVAAYSMRDTAGQTIHLRAQFARTNPLLDSVEIRAVPAAAEPYPDWWPSYLLQQYLMAPYSYFPYSLYALYREYYSYIVETLTTPISRVLGEVEPKRVQFNANGTTDFVTFDLKEPQLSNMGVGIHPMRWVWQYRRSAGHMWLPFGDSQHTIYTLLATPTFPWKQQAFNSLNTQLPWTDVMDFACQWASGSLNPEEATARITRNVFDLGPTLLEYDCVGGGNNHYATPIGSGFDCTAFLELLRGGSGNGRYVNCTDCATIVSTFANVLGCDLWQSRMGTVIGPIIFFAVNPIRAIGASTFGVPCGWPGFTYHEVAWTDNCSAADMVCDACLEVNGAANPTSAPRIPLLPAGLRFGATGDGQYRDRLAAPAARALCEPRPDTRVRRIVF